MKNENDGKKVYLVGGGIASLAAAVYLIQDAGLKGADITLFHDSEKFGGSLDAKYIEEQGGYVMRGIRMFEEKSFNATFDLMSRIPSLTSPEKNLREDFLDYNKENKTCSKSRLVSRGKALEQKALRLNLRDKLSLVTIFLRREKSLEYLKIEDYFSPAFFQSNFWYEFCTVFAFEPWHSLMEFRRYFIRFVQDFPVIDTLEGVEVTPYNQYDSLIWPALEWLKKAGVNFAGNTKVVDFKFEDKDGKTLLKEIHCEVAGNLAVIKTTENDLVFSTLGSMVANSSIGSMQAAPVYQADKKSVAWSLWENIANKSQDFGSPKNFSEQIDKSKWISFTLTCKDRTLPDLLTKFIDRKVSNFGGVNLINSSWFMSLVINYRPYFVNQAKDTYICWGFGLFPDKIGNHIKKKMTECSGEEIMKELIFHLGFEKDEEKIINSLVCIPCFTPYVTSQFLPRAITDRPAVVPKGALNFAFLGQFCEVPQDVVFTVDYSVRSAQTAVYHFFPGNKKVTPIYHGLYHLRVVYKSLKTLFR